jgi:NADPH:quinone reductase-like Zn-dependent oxidoreductase
MPETMRAMGADAAGAPDSLRILEVPVPEPAAGQVRIRVAAAAVNPADHRVLHGAFSGRFVHARTAPLLLGYDVSGTVDAVGESVDDLAPGDEVFGHLPYAGATAGGTFAEQVVLHADAVGRKPSAVSHAVAAAAATTGLTALQVLRDVAAIGEGKRAMIIGAAGGVGSAAVAIAKRLGGQVCGVCSSDAVGFVRELGADEVVDRKRTDPLAHPGGFDLVFDTPAAHSFAACRRLLGDAGVYVTTLPSPAFVLGKLLALFSRRRCEMTVVVSRRADLEQLAAWIADGLRIEIAQTHPVRDVGQGIADIVRGGRMGRIAVDVANGW